MKTLEQIKDDYAVSKGFENWKDLIKNTFDWFVLENLDIHIREVMILAQKECLKRAVNNKILYPHKGMPLINSDDVTNENNIIK